jgi:hypothetical protein
MCSSLLESGEMGGKALEDDTIYFQTEKFQVGIILEFNSFS